MAGLFLDEGRKAVLNILFASGRNPKAKLFTNSFALTQDKVLGDFTAPAFTGYAALDLSGMAAAIINGAGQGQKKIDPATWTCTTTGSQYLCYGYLITIEDNASTERAIFADRFPGPVAVQNNGDAVSLPITFLDTIAP